MCHRTSGRTIVLKKAIETCELLGQTGNNKQIYLYHQQHQQSSPILREIGRLRETAFRAVGEGSGNRRDIDKFDDYYQQLVLWDKDDLEIVGAYRLVDSFHATRHHGLSGLYTSSLFQFGEPMQPYPVHRTRTRTWFHTTPVLGQTQPGLFMAGHRSLS